MSEMTRELIKSYQNEIKDKEILPQRAAEILMDLSALLGNINDEIRIKDIEYNRILMKIYETQEKANRAKIMAETTPEYEAKRLARDTKDLVIEMIRSIKYFLRSKEEEWRAGSNF